MSVASTVTVTVNGVNDLPVAADDSYIVNQDDELNISASGVISNDTDPYVNDGLVVTQVNGTAFTGQTTVTTDKGAVLTISSDGSFDYDPRGSATLLALKAGESENDSFEYEIVDPHGEVSSATVTIVVQGVNDAPVANPDSYTVDQAMILRV